MVVGCGGVCIGAVCIGALSGYWLGWCKLSGLKKDTEACMNCMTPYIARSERHTAALSAHATQSVQCPFDESAQLVHLLVRSATRHMELFACQK